MNLPWDEIYIKRCFELAQKGLGLVSPNPLVGAVIVKNQKVIGEGFHQSYGQAHAEPDAISNSVEDVEGSTLYCNLEPCCHTNKQTPPCTDLIIKRKIKRVVISNLDPNPNVAGRGVQILKDAGIDVVVGVLKEQGEVLNEVFFKWIISGTPFIHLKWAQTLDGKIATLSGDSKWISDEHARLQVHQMRMKYDAVLIGRETLNRDNPRLDIRHVDAKNKVPWRIIVGGLEKVNSDTICAQNADGKSLFVGKINDSKESWVELLNGLGKERISSILVEGGGQILSSLLKYQLYDRISVYIAPKILGAGKGYSDLESEKISNSLQLKLVNVEQIGSQIKLDYLRG